VTYAELDEFIREAPTPHAEARAVCTAIAELTALDSENHD
jgi:hypothetical protein